MSPQPIVYHFALLRVVPHVHLGAFTNVGVILHARTSEYLALRLLDGAEILARVGQSVDGEMLERYLRRFEEICSGNPAGGPVALLPPSERFHWLTAPRSDVLQASPVHEGVCESAQEALDKVFGTIVSS